MGRSGRQNDLLRNLGTKSDEPSEMDEPPVRRLGAVAAMKLALYALTAEAADTRGHPVERELVQDLDPTLFRPSVVSDRIPTTEDARYQSLKAAVRDNGQLIPIIARPDPINEGRFQIAAGHRRWHVAQELGQPLRAIIRSLSDEEMVVLQGQENGARADLSYIERARFAAQMLSHGYSRSTLSAALNVDKPEVSRLLTVAQSIGEELMLAIGPAPKVGRPRWLKLAKALESPTARHRLEVIVSSDEFRGAVTDRRFSMVWESVGDPGDGDDERLTVSDRLAWIESDGTETRLVSANPGFAKFLARRLPDLVKEFARSAEFTSAQVQSVIVRTT